MDRKIKSIQKDTKKLAKKESALLKADMKQDKKPVFGDRNPGRIINDRRSGPAVFQDVRPTTYW